MMLLPLIFILQQATASNNYQLVQFHHGQGIYFENQGNIGFRQAEATVTTTIDVSHTIFNASENFNNELEGMKRICRNNTLCNTGIGLVQKRFTMLQEAQEHLETAFKDVRTTNTIPAEPQPNNFSDTTQFLQKTQNLRRYDFSRLLTHAMKRDNTTKKEEYTSYIEAWIRKSIKILTEYL